MMAPFLNGIKASLACDDITLVAAISRLTAEDYLLSGAFSTVVLCPSALDDEATKLLKSIKQLPMAQPPRVILLLRPDLANAFGHDVAGADQIVDLSPELDFVAKQIQSVCLSPDTGIETSPWPFRRGARSVDGTCFPRVFRIACRSTNGAS